MIRSMTAFGRATGKAPGRDIIVEIKSVNNRFFDCQVKLPRLFSFLEDKVKKQLSSRGIARGRRAYQYNYRCARNSASASSYVRRICRSGRSSI